MEEKAALCPVCGSTTPCHVNYDRDLVFYHCPVCGNYQLGAYWQDFDKNHLAAFLAHNAYDSANDFEQRYYSTVSKEVCDQLQPVIQLCQEGVQLHFDIAQKNAIIWASVEDIPERLRKRILATIE